MVLAALMVMGFTRMRAAGDHATTVSVLRQLQFGNVSYASDRGGQYVPLSVAYRHHNKAVVVYYDGSSGVVSPGDIRAFDKQGGPTILSGRRIIGNRQGHPYNPWRPV